MEVEKRQQQQQSKGLFDVNQKKTSTDDLNNFRRNSVSLLEDLSNDVIYEIFDYFDFCHIYNAFSNLNIRFENLLYDLTLPIKIKFSSMSKSIFQRYYTQIIIPNRHRIKSLHLSNSFIIDQIFSPISILTEFIRLESLTFHDIRSNNLQNFLIYLHILPCLFSLDIDCLDRSTDIGGIYREIFRLPVLKSCKLSLNGPMKTNSLPITTTDFSSIENLVIENHVNLLELDGLLSYVPQLHRLSINILSEFSSAEIDVSYTIQLNHLKYVSLTLTYIEFSEFELLTKSFFHHVEVLYISIEDESTYLDGNRWKQLILSNLSNLRVFDMINFNKFDFDKDSLELSSIIETFHTSFWFERQWFFEYQIKNNLQGGCNLVFYSINPYRRRSYGLHGEIFRKSSLSNVEYIRNSVDSIIIYSQEAMINCKKYFSNATVLIIDDTYNNDYNNSFTIELKIIISLKKFTKLCLHVSREHFFQFIELLDEMPNIYTFEISPIQLNDKELKFYEKSERFQLLSKRNNIKQMTIGSSCTWKVIKFLIYLCPQLIHLNIIDSNDIFKPLLRYLFSKNHKNTRHLSSLIIQLYRQTCTQLDHFLVYENFIDINWMSTMLNVFNSRIHFWW